MKLLLGLASHAPGSGKSMAADYLERTHGFTSLGAGDLVKAEIAEMLQTQQIIYREEAKSVFRPLLSSWAILRKELNGPDYWNDQVLQMWRASLAQRIVMPDLRTPRELDLVHKLGGFAVLITRTDAGISQDPLEGLLKEANFDFELNNNHNDGGESMFAQLDALIAHVGPAGTR